jgi:hypothetical protein
MPTLQITHLEEDALKALGDATPIFVKVYHDHITAETLENMLNKAIGMMLPPEIKKEGSIYLCRFNNPERLCADIDFIPTSVGQTKLGYLRSIIGIVNLEKKGYAMNPNAEPSLRELKELYPATERIMQQLGLTNLKEYKRSER